MFYPGSSDTIILRKNSTDDKWDHNHFALKLSELHDTAAEM